MDLKDYIKTVHNGNQLQFVDEVSHFENQKRILDTIEKKNIWMVNMLSQIGL